MLRVLISELLILGMLGVIPLTLLVLKILVQGIFIPIVFIQGLIHVPGIFELEKLVLLVPKIYESRIFALLQKLV